MWWNLWSVYFFLFFFLFYLNWIEDVIIVLDHSEVLEVDVEQGQVPVSCKVLIKDRGIILLVFPSYWEKPEILGLAWVLSEVCWLCLGNWQNCKRKKEMVMPIMFLKLTYVWPYTGFWYKQVGSSILMKEERIRRWYTLKLTLHQWDYVHAWKSRKYLHLTYVMSCF